MKHILLLLLFIYPTFSEEAIIKSKPIERINSPFEMKYGKIDAIDEELICLSEAIYFESRSLPTKGQALVAQVILNRVKSKKFPNTVCGVVNKASNNKALPKNCAFTYKCDGKPETIANPIAWDKAVRIADKALRGEYKDLTNADHYTRCDVKIYWQKSMKLVYTDNTHCFYKS